MVVGNVITNLLLSEKIKKTLEIYWLLYWNLEKWNSVKIKEYSNETLIIHYDLLNCCLVDDSQEKLEKNLEENSKKNSKKNSQEKLEKNLEENLEKNSKKNSKKNSQEKLEKNLEENLEKNLEENLEKNLENIKNLIRFLFAKFHNNDEKNENKYALHIIIFLLNWLFDISNYEKLYEYITYKFFVNFFIESKEIKTFKETIIEKFKTNNI